jgi:hypothetical protein
MKPYIDFPLGSEPRWLSAMVSMFVWGGSAAIDDDLASRLVVELGRTMPVAHIERDGHWLGLDLRLADPANQDERIAAWLVLCATAIEIGLDTRLLGMLDWILRPASNALPDRITVLSDRNAYEARDFGLRIITAPLVSAILSAPHEYGMAGSLRGFRAFHLELAPVERYLVRIFAQSPKTAGRRENITGRRSPFSDAELVLVATNLAARGWIKDLGPNKWGGTPSARRGRLLSGLTSKELLPE